MIKTLRLIGVVAAILAVVFLVLSLVFGVRSDPKLEGFVKSAGAVEQFKAAKVQKAGKDDEISPLVKEAGAFALYLSPPPPPPPKVSENRSAEPPRPKVVAPKFTLVGTSYYALHPEMSLALIDEPGNGFRWVKQSDKIEHLVIDQIKDGVIVVKDGDSSFELEAPKPPERSLVKGKGVQAADIDNQSVPTVASSVPRTTSSSVGTKPVPVNIPDPLLKRPAAVPQRRTRPPGRSDAEKKAMMEKLVGIMQTTGKGSSDSNSSGSTMKKIVESMQGGKQADPNKPKDSGTTVKSSAAEDKKSTKPEPAKSSVKKDQSPTDANNRK